MKVGIPKGLLYNKYHPFITTFFKELGAEITVSPDTNKEILDLGVKYSVDEACLPIKIFHGHVAKIKGECDIMLIPRIMQLKEKEYICPKFCGLPEMILNSIPNMPKSITTPIYAGSKKKLYRWAIDAGQYITQDKTLIFNAFNKAIIEQRKHITGIKNEKYNINIALSGHPYNIYDNYTNMNIVEKLNKLGVGVITEEYLSPDLKEINVKKLYKKPFWTFFKESYGFVTYQSSQKKTDGIIYISSFACGIDSVVTELIKCEIGDFPLLLLKIDEQTGEAGLDTRIEAFVDMLERRQENESDIPSHG